jgi:hypothetical protein
MVLEKTASFFVHLINFQASAAVSLKSGQSNRKRNFEKAVLRFAFNEVSFKIQVVQIS